MLWPTGLAALWDLLRGFQQADELSQQQDDPLLGDLPERDAQQLKGGLITMLMRLVFLSTPKTKR